MSDPRDGRRRDRHVQDESVTLARGDGGGDTRSDTYRDDSSRREIMQQELMNLGAWLSEHPEAARKNLKPIRGKVMLDPGVYFNIGTGMVDRVYVPQHIALGSRMFRIKTDPAAPIQEIRRRVMEGK